MVSMTGVSQAVAPISRFKLFLVALQQLASGHGTGPNLPGAQTPAVFDDVKVGAPESEWNRRSRW